MEAVHLQGFNRSSATIASPTQRVNVTHEYTKERRFNRSSATIASPTDRQRQLTRERDSVSIAQARQLPLQRSVRCRPPFSKTCFNRSSATIASPTVEGVSLRALQYQVSIAQARQLPLQLSGSALLTVQGSSVS